MKQLRFIYTEKNHKWGVVCRDPSRASYMIDTNECIVIDGDEGLITDPGGMEIFPSVFSAIGSGFNPKNIKTIFSSHQDPDVISSLTLWLELNPDLKCYISRLWTTFVPHFGGDDKTLVGIPDEGTTLSVGTVKLKVVPAHYLHSSGNFHLYDSRAKIYFSGDVGAAILPEGADLYVKNFDEHIKSAIGFHKRWMGSNEAKDDWCKRASELEIDMIIPQHGAIYQGKDVQRFINWFSELRVGLFTSAPDISEAAVEDKSEKIATPADMADDSSEIIEIGGIPNVAAQTATPEIAETDHSDLEALMEDNARLKKKADQDTMQKKNSFINKIKKFFSRKE